jgi:hypothetical protein
MLGKYALREQARLFVVKADLEVGHDDGDDVGRPDPGAITPEVDDLTVGGVKAAGSARAPAVVQHEAVASSFDLDLNRFVVRERADGLGIEGDLKPSWSKLEGGGADIALPSWSRFTALSLGASRPAVFG